ncbi:cold shock domain-containing protein [Nocardia puris]|nr:cold shock domain-containing protein [Nocardia puris]MBF6368215.1 cold shock domain-containing protein [Nocardia puris]MBF6458066.1 cold shock domain-containing protein [Nocardia puris]
MTTIHSPTDTAPVPDAAPAHWHHGTVAWFNAEKGFGFLTPDDGTAAVFVDFTSIDVVGYRTLSAGQPVIYTMRETRRGPEAACVRPYSRAQTGSSARIPLARLGSCLPRWGARDRAV